MHIAVFPSDGNQIDKSVKSQVYSCFWTTVCQM